MTIRYIDRVSGREETEEVYGERALRFLYGEGWLSKSIGVPLLHTLCRIPFISSFYGAWQKLSFTKKKIQPFIKRFNLDPSEFLLPISAFTSFNDFFIRKLKPEVRPIAPGDDCAVIPADGRFRFYQDLAETDGFYVKGQRFSLASLLQDQQLADRYKHGSMVIGRLCPTDYHRFHFPCEGIPSVSITVNGWLYSVNPIAIKKDIQIFTKNKRSICEIVTERFGKVLYLEIGATNVGSIHQTYQPLTLVTKGSEKGFFSFGGSSIILLFEPDRIVFEEDLIALNEKGLEIRCLVGQPLGKLKY